MFEQFLQVFGPEPDGNPSPIWETPDLVEMTGYSEIVPRLSGLTLGQGLFRFLTKADGPLAQRSIKSAFPEFLDRPVPFARDWLGRYFALDRQRRSSTVSQLLLLEPGSGEVFEIDEPFADFLNIGLVNDTDTYLESKLFDEWRLSGGGVPLADQCVGFKIPLFLGGAGSIENLEISDVQVYWHVCGQTRLATRGLPLGTRISGLELRD